MEHSVLYRCRLCLATTSRKIDVFKQDFPKMIELLTGIKADPNDNLPKESCLDCAEDIKFCMSVRKQIIESHRILLRKILNNESVTPSSELSSLETEYKTERVKYTQTIKRKRNNSPVTTSEEGYSSTDDSDSKSKENLEEITVVNQVAPKSKKFNNDIESDFKDPLTVQSIKLEKRLRRKQNMIAASNQLLNQEKSVPDRRYSNVVFVRKSLRVKREPKPKIEEEKPKVDDSNVIWKDGKKYASCEVCKREVKKQYLKHHMSTHFPEHFSCDVCGVVTRNMRGLRYHKLYWHSSKLDYICDKCGKKYRSKHALDLHNKKEHGGERDLECNICGKKFFQNMHLKRHIDGIHKKLRPHKCEFCGKDFTKRTHLVTHWRTHTNETPYPCDMCGERFKLKLSLKNHLRRAHNFEEEEQVFCTVCNRGFATEQGLRAHINSRVHEGEKCQYCSESFTPEYLKVHLRQVHMHVDYY